MLKHAAVLFNNKTWLQTHQTAAGTQASEASVHKILIASQAQ
jgi:hypothetical protein